MLRKEAHTVPASSLSAASTMVGPHPITKLEKGSKLLEPQQDCLLMIEIVTPTRYDALYDRLLGSSSKILNLLLKSSSYSEHFSASSPPVSGNQKYGAIRGVSHQLVPGGPNPLHN
ncbi:hypothetical protein QQP08_012091 [Theobroma cacao]|nr:hypothetical protein QQP08_012091 [Theobroma cacao]